MTAKKLRTERTLTLVDLQLTQDAQVQLASLYNDLRYDALLDVIERGCILQDTNLINTPAHDEAKVLAEHKVSKAFWQTFVWIQTQVRQAHLTMTKQAEPEQEPPTEEEFLQGVE
jgi:hypothetical protein